MTQSVLQKFFDEFDKDKDPDSPPRLSGMTNYLFNLGKTANPVFQRIPATDNLLKGFGFTEIDEIYSNGDHIYDLARKMIFALVNRIRLERERRPLILFNADILRSFLELKLIYFGSNRNISNLEKKLWLVCKDLLTFLVLGKPREIQNLAEESSIVSIANFNERIDQIFENLKTVPCIGVIVLAFIFLCSEKIKSLDDENQFEEELMAEEQNVEVYIEQKLTELLTQKIDEAFPKPEPPEEEDTLKLD